MLYSKIVYKTARPNLPDGEFQNAKSLSNYLYQNHGEMAGLGKT